MEMDDNKLKRLLQEGMEWDADCIMAEVDSDPSVKDVIAPEEIHDKLMQQIREHEQTLETEEERLSQEEQELIRLGKKYKKKRGRRKYIVLIVAAVCALGVGTISFGDGKKVFTEVKRLLSDREQNVVNTPSERHAVYDEVASEEAAYEQVNEKFGFYPVRIMGLPEGMSFSEIAIDEALQMAQLYYVDADGRMIVYRVTTNNRESSVGVDVEDTLIQEYEKEIKKTLISIKEYNIEENDTERWVISFVYKDAQYSMILTGMNKEEVEEITEGLYFL